MTRHLFPRVAAAALCLAGLMAVPTVASAAFERVPSQGTAFRKQSGTLTACRGATCKPLFVRNRNGAFTRLSANTGTLSLTNRQTQVCYVGYHNACV
jgi:hypothetical protein